MNKRVLIYTSDVQRITGKSLRTCQRMINDLKAAQGKKKHQLSTFSEFCEFYSIEITEIDQNTPST